MYSNTGNSAKLCIADESLSGRLGLFFAIPLVAALLLGYRAAEAPVILTVKQDGTGDYTTISAALAAVPDPLTDAYTIEIQDSGTYNETVSISKTTSSANGLTLRSQTGQTPTVVVQNTYAAIVDLLQLGFASHSVAMGYNTGLCPWHYIPDFPRGHTHSPCRYLCVRSRLPPSSSRHRMVGGKATPAA